MKIEDYWRMILNAQRIHMTSPLLFEVYVKSNEWPEFRISLSNTFDQSDLSAEIWGTYGRHVFRFGISIFEQFQTALRCMAIGKPAKANPNLFGPINDDRQQPKPKPKKKAKEQNGVRADQLLTCNGKTQSLRQWGEELDIRICSLRHRLKRGWSIEKTLSTPPQPGHPRGGDRIDHVDIPDEDLPY